MLSSSFVRYKAGRLVPVVLSALILAGCPGPAPQTPPTNIQDEASASSDYYLQQLQQSSDNNKADWQLLAIRALTREGKLSQAAAQLNTLPQNMSRQQLLERQLLSAELQVANKNYPAARNSLARIDEGALSPNQRVRLYQAQIAANQGRSSLPLIRAYIAQEPLLAAKAHQDNLDQTWRALLGLSAKDLNSLAINANENVLQGWLDLLRVYQDNRQDPDMLKAGIKDWQNRYPQNPAAKNLPSQLNRVLNFTQASTSHIALLLPLNGQAKVFADAIQQGFTAAKNGVTIATPVQPPQQQPQPTATPDQSAPGADPNANGAVSTSAPTADEASAAAPQPATATPVNTPITPPQAANAQVRVYDTTSQPLPALLAQAQQDGATLVVGPLLKTDVDQLATAPTTLQVLALNQPGQPQDTPNVCYFALSPEDEARDAARHIWQQQKRQPLLLLPRGSFGERIAKAFNEEWQKLGGQTVLQQSIGSAGELRQMVNSGGIRLSGTPVAAAAPQSVTIAGLTIPAPPSDIPAASSGSVDAVYIVATQSQLTLIKPMIDMTTSSRGKPAMFASSRSYQAGSGPDFRLEMEGLQFSDIPLLAGANPQLLRQASARLRNDYSLVRLYAMGMDAWTLANHFAEMRQLPGFQLSGTTGELSSSSNCVISRKLTWLQYRQGSIVPAN